MHPQVHGDGMLCRQTSQVKSERGGKDWLWYTAAEIVSFFLMTAF